MKNVIPNTALKMDYLNAPEYKRENLITDEPVMSTFALIINDLVFGLIGRGYDINILLPPTPDELASNIEAYIGKLPDDYVITLGFDIATNGFFVTYCPISNNFSDFDVL